MAISLLNWALRQTDVRGPAKCVLIVLANRADRVTRQCFPSLHRISSESGLSKATVARCLTELERMQKIQRQRQEQHAGTTVYTFKPVSRRDTSSIDLSQSETTLSQCETAPVSQRDSLLREEKESTKEKEEKGPTINEPSLTLAESTAFPQPPSAAARPRDLAGDVFAEVFRNLHRPAEYLFRKGDWVWLAQLRKAQHLEPKAAPEFWRETCTNYLASPLPKYTLADLCTRYEIFFRSGVDRFNRPNGGDYAPRERTKAQITIENSEKVLARLNQQDRDCEQRGAERRNNRGLSGGTELPFSAAAGSSDDPHD